MTISQEQCIAARTTMRETIYNTLHDFLFDLVNAGDLQDESSNDKLIQLDKAIHDDWLDEDVDAILIDCDHNLMVSTSHGIDSEIIENREFSSLSTHTLISIFEEIEWRLFRNKIKPKFKVGDCMRTIEEANNNITEQLPFVVSIDDEYYHCNNETIPIREQDNYEYPAQLHSC